MMAGSDCGRTGQWRPSMGSRPAGHSDGREHHAVCDETSQISMGLSLGFILSSISKAYLTRS
ncbi:hypothetical protein NK6_8906 [Bradyrhizobium diazoefficiens]|uniref:Uncharacterized protein n=1 Tax=Bradyrhizobium diazoefficiens TaxID=1355477 RepID=A0A0E3VX51_9BRAD|nr:hypothetical protein NK6_8906 [Bradyrhizobium diazoefficiens]